MRRLKAFHLISQLLFVCINKSLSVLILVFMGCFSLGLHASEERLKQLEMELEQLKLDYQDQEYKALVQEENIVFSGFFSLRGGRSSADSDYVANFDTVVKVEPEWNMQIGSLFGIQALYTLNDKLSSQVQFVARGSEDFKVSLELGFVEYRPTESSSFRLGRLRPTIYRLSEYLDVGYAYPWVGPPAEMYGIFPYSAYQGVDYRYWTSAGDWDFKINPYIGFNEGRDVITSPKGAFYGIDLQANYRDFIFRIGLSNGRLTFVNGAVENNVDTLINGKDLIKNAPAELNLRQPGIFNLIDMASLALNQEANVTTDPAKKLRLLSEAQSLQAQKANYPVLSQDGSSTDAQFLGAGITYDNGKWLIMAEISQATTGSYISDSESGYISFGRRLGNMMPYLRWAMHRVTDTSVRPQYQDVQFTNPDNIMSSQTKIPALKNITVGEAYSQALGGTQAMTQGLRQTMQFLALEQKSFTLGLRWDLLSSLAIKLEAQRVYDFNSSPGFFAPAADNDFSSARFPEVDEHEYIYQFSIDAVF